MAKLPEKQKFEALCSLTVDYVRACVQSAPAARQGPVLTEQQLNACLELARQTVKLFEKEYYATQESENDGVLH